MGLESLPSDSEQPVSPIAVEATAGPSPRFRVQVVPAFFSFLLGLLFVTGATFSLYRLVANAGQHDSAQIREIDEYFRGTRDQVRLQVCVGSGLLVGAAACAFTSVVFYIRTRWRVAISLSLATLALALLAGAFVS